MTQSAGAQPADSRQIEYHSLLHCFWLKKNSHCFSTSEQLRDCCNITPNLLKCKFSCKQHSHWIHTCMHTGTQAHSYESTFIMIPEVVSVWQCWHHCCMSAGRWLLSVGRSPFPLMSALAPPLVEGWDGLRKLSTIILNYFTLKVPRAWRIEPWVRHIRLKQ